MRKRIELTVEIDHDEKQDRKRYYLEKYDGDELRAKEIEREERAAEEISSEYAEEADEI